MFDDEKYPAITWKCQGLRITSIEVDLEEFASVGWYTAMEKLTPYEVCLDRVALNKAHRWCEENCSNWFIPHYDCMRFRSKADAVAVKLIFSEKKYENNRI